MTRNPWERRRKAKLFFAVLAFGLVMSALVAIGLVYMEQMHPHS